MQKEKNTKSEFKEKIINGYKSIIMEQEEIDNYDNHELYVNMLEKIYDEDNTKDIKHNGSWCDTCQNDDVIEDSSQGIVVCKICGQVIANLLDNNPDWNYHGDGDKRDTGRNCLTISKLLPQSSIASTIGGNCSSRIKTLHGWGAMPYKERSLNDVFKIIHSKCVEGNILKCIEDDAKIMYKNISDCKHLEGMNMNKNIIIRGINRKSLIAACILNACRKKDKPRSPKEIAKLFNLKYTEITKGCKTFSKLAKMKNIEIKTNSIKPEHFIARFCEELKIKKEYADQANQISNNVQKLHIASVHTPLSLATGAIYMMIQLNCIDIQKKTIADKFNVSQVTIAKAYKKLEPFKKILINDSICDKLNKEIIKYKENIELTNNLKPKFLRFNININSKNSSEDPYSIYDEKNKVLNEKLIAEHTIELYDQHYRFVSAYTNLQMINFVNIYKLLYMK